MNINDKLEKLTNEKLKIDSEIELLKELVKKYPDLQIHKNRWNQEKYCAKSVNDKVTQFYTKHSCGCCYDAALYACFYLEDNKIKIYADPPEISIGYGSYTGDVLNLNFDIELKKYNIPTHFIERITKQYEDTSWD